MQRWGEFNLPVDIRCYMVVVISEGQYMHDLIEIYAFSTRQAIEYGLSLSDGHMNIRSFL
jgi:hypothetical protein